MDIVNGKINSFYLGYEDHGMLTMSIEIEFAGGIVQAFGGYQLDAYNKNLDRRVGRDFGIEFLFSVANVVGVREIQEIRGKIVRVKRYRDGGPIEELGHIIEDRWFSPKELHNQIAREYRDGRRIAPAPIDTKG